METNLSASTASSGSVPPLMVTLIVIASAIYQLFPLDIIPDPIPVIGNADDLVAFLIAVSAAKKVKRQ